MKTIGDKILELRKKNGLSQESLGFEVGVSRQTISKWEANVVQPSLDNMTMLCKTFNVDLSFFIDEDKSNFEHTIKEEVVVSDEAQKDICKRKKGILIALSVFIGLIEIVLAFLSVILGHTAFSPNKGDYNVSIYDVNPKLFYASIFLFLVLMVVEIVLIVKICKKRKM